MKVTVLDLITLKGIFRKLITLDYNNFKDAIDIAEYCDALETKTKSFYEIQKKLTEKQSSIKSEEELDNLQKEFENFYNTKLEFNDFKLKEEYINRISFKPFEAKCLQSLGIIEFSKPSE